VDTTRCEQCGGDLVEIELTVDGRDLVMSSCSTCDTRTWRSDGEEVEFDGVIADLSSSDRRYKRSLSN